MYNKIFYYNFMDLHYTAKEMKFYLEVPFSLNLELQKCL